eukprot:826324-Pyramimonas_sp.AAC.1
MKAQDAGISCNWLMTEGQHTSRIPKCFCTRAESSSGSLSGKTARWKMSVNAACHLGARERGSPCPSAGSGTRRARLHGSGQGL